MSTESVRIGWRPYVTAQQLQTSTYLLDSYSGAAAAYSLRKLKSSYTGSAIRVRRSSDNTELNIGFDSDGNLDTYSLSAFVGTGNGFVTTWYDQSGNVKNATQTTAANQPYIIVSGTLQTLNGKPSLFFNGESKYLDCGYLNNGTKPANFSTFISANFTAVNQTRSIFSSMDAGGNGKDTYNTFGIHSATPTPYQMFGGAGGGIYYKYWRTSNVPTQSLPYLFEQHYKSNISPFMGTFYWNNTAQSTTEWFQGSSTISGGTEFKTSIGRSGENNGGYHQGFVQEIATYFSDQMSNRSGINTNLNTYYSIYPNPTSVWNLLTAAYNADTKSLPSLKTSLFAAYNGESNTNDSKGTNNGTAVGGLTYTTGKIGNAFSFNGTNAYVSLPNNSLNPSGDFTISFWVKFNSVAATYINLIENYYNPSFNSRYGFNMYLQSGKIRFATYDGSITNIAQSTTTFVVNQWYQIILSKKINTAPKLYVNGLNETFTQLSGNISNNPVYNSLCKSLFGVDFDYSVSYNSYLNGSLDAINIWNKELTTSEVSELYNSGNGAQYITDNFYKPTTNNALGTNNGTAVGGLTYEVGKVGTAFKFNGSNAYVNMGDVMDIGTSSWSYSMWFNSSNLSVTTALFSKHLAAAGTGRIWLNNYGNAIQFNFEAETSNTITIQTTTSFTTNTWYHLVCILDRSDKLKIYLNGVLQSVSIASGSNNLIPYNGVNYNTSIPFRVGCTTMSDNTTPYAFFNGQIDAFNVWNRVLTATEVTELYNSGNGKQYPN